MCIIVKNNKSLFICLYNECPVHIYLDCQISVSAVIFAAANVCACVCVLYVGGWVCYVDSCVRVCMLRSRSILCNSGILLLILKFVQSTVIP